MKLPLPQVDGLSLDAEATKKAPDMVQEPFIQVPESLDPVWIFYDFAHYWIGPIASQFLIIILVAFLGPSSLLIDGGAHREKPEDFAKLNSLPINQMMSEKKCSEYSMYFKIF